MRYQRGFLSWAEKGEEMDDNTIVDMGDMGSSLPDMHWHGPDGHEELSTHVKGKAVHEHEQIWVARVEKVDGRYQIVGGYREEGPAIFEGDSPHA